MKFFIDSANVSEIAEALARGFVSGVTTNPSLLAKEPKGKFEDRIGEIVTLLKEHSDRWNVPPLHLSVEVFSRDAQEMLGQAKDFARMFGYTALSVKVQVGWNELAVVHELARAGVSVNCTACMSVTQAMMAAHAGARYVSLFWGRIRDGGSKAEDLSGRNELAQKRVLDTGDYDPAVVTGRVRALLDGIPALNAEIIVGSIRGVVDVRDAMLAGAHIVTVPPKFFHDMISHFKTDEVINQFLKEFNEWLA